MKQRILNIGSGRENYGTDFIDLFPKRAEVIKCDISKETLPYRDKTFDIVYSRRVIAHLSDPYNFFYESYRVLKKGGKIMVDTHNANVMFAMRTYNGSFKGEYKIYCLFNAHSLKNCLEEVGFKNVTVRHVFDEPEKYQRDMTTQLGKQVHLVLGAIDKTLKPVIIATGYK